ncbi:hypothetical protein, partial [Pseudomonas pergaminensis]
MARLGLLLNGVRRITSSNFCTIVPNDRFKRSDEGSLSVGDARKWARKKQCTNLVLAQINNVGAGLPAMAVDQRIHFSLTRR